MVIAFFCLAAGLAGFALEKKSSPAKVLFLAKGGPVVFDHPRHIGPDKAGLECAQCHHNYDPNGGKQTVMRCRECHYDARGHAAGACKEAKIHTRCIGSQCADCHGLDDCSLCHKR